MTTIQDRSHRNLAAFVDWIKPEPDVVTKIVEQSKEIRGRISAQATTDGLTVISTPDSGSFAKNTGLRRHMRGGSDVEGQDVDLPFELHPVTEEGEKLQSLLPRFEKYAVASYPRTPRAITGSSVELQFTSTKLNFDLVPVLSTSLKDYQIILKSDGSRRLTSISKHTQFVRSRTASSSDLAGRVKFNECVRLMKWWRCVRIDGTGSIDKVRTILIELLCAAAYDQLKVETTYTDTLHKWFAWLADITATRKKIAFSDFKSIETSQLNHVNNHLWEVLDPVNATNNVVPTGWGNIELQEFSEWFADARDAFSRLKMLEQAGRDGDADEILSELFGNAVITHGVAA